MPAERFDVAILGGGPAGESVVAGLAGSGRSVVLAERELVGGECPYWACMPSKTLLRPGEIQADARRFPGLIPAEEEWDVIAAYRDKIISHLDDSEKASHVQQNGAKLVRGAATIVRPGRISVGGEEIAYKDLVIATGTVPLIPPIAGLEQVDAWTTREVTGMARPPRDAIVLGGGPVGMETAQMLRRLGCGVTLIESGSQLCAGEDADAGKVVERVFTEEGIDVQLGSEATRVERTAEGVGVELQNGAQFEAQRLILALGRTPRIDDLGLEEIGITPGESGGIDVDEHCRAGDHVWAAGDVTSVMPFTHVAHYQGELVAAGILGSPRVADYRAMPRTVFTDPEVASVGLTMSQCKEQQMKVAIGTAQVADLSRPGTYGTGKTGFMTVLCDLATSTLVGAVAVGPLASEYIGAAVMAIQLRAPVETLVNTPMQFPTFGEALPKAVRALKPAG